MTMITNDLAPASRSAEPHREQKAIGTFQMPTALLDKIPEEHRDELFILILDGDCLEPEVHHDDRAIVAPGMPIRPGDFVVLWPKKPGHRPQIKRVVVAPMRVGRSSTRRLGKSCR